MASIKNTPLLASAIDDGNVILWDTNTGKAKRALKAHNGPVWSVDVTSDGKRMATAGDDGLVKIWNLEDEESTEPVEILESDNGALVRCVKFDPTGTTIAAGTRQGKLLIWGCAAGAKAGKPLVVKAHVGALMSIAFSPDSKKIVTGGGDKLVRIWNAATGAEGLKLEGHAGAVYGVTFSPDGNQIASGSWDRTARIWDTNTGEQKKKLEGHKGDVWAVTFCPAGRILITGSEDRTARAWDWEKGTELARFTGHESTVTSVAFDGDGKYIATGSRDGTIKLWSPKCK